MGIPPLFPPTPPTPCCPQRRRHQVWGAGRGGRGVEAQAGGGAPRRPHAVRHGERAALRRAALLPGGRVVCVAAAAVPAGAACAGPGCCSPRPPCRLTSVLHFACSSPVPQVGPEEIATVVSKWTGIPVTKLQVRPDLGWGSGLLLLQQLPPSLLPCHVCGPCSLVPTRPWRPTAGLRPRTAGPPGGLPARARGGAGHGCVSFQAGEGAVAAMAAAEWATDCSLEHGGAG